MLALPLPSTHRPRTWPASRLFAFFDAVRDHRVLFILTWVALLGAAVLAWAVIPTRYQATASVLIQMKTTDPIAGIALPGGLISNHLTTQMEVMRSEKVALRALKVLQPQEDAAWRSQWQQATGGRGVYESWAADRLLRQLDVRNTRDSNVLVLAYKDGDAERAARFANGLVQSYLEAAVDLRQQPARQYSSFFDEKMRRAKDLLEAAQHRLVEFQQRNGIHSLDERADVEERRLAELASQITLLEARIAETRGKYGEAGAASQEAVRDPIVIEARIELARQEARMGELESRLGSGHPELQRQQQAVSQRRAILAAALGRAAYSLGAGGRAESAQLATLKTNYQQQEDKVLGRKTLREEAMRMQKNVDNLQRNYELVLARYQTTTLESEDVQPNISILKVATPPAKPVTPALPWFLSGGALLGLAAALAAVFFRERIDARLRYAEHVVEVLQKPFLVQLPYRRSAPADTMSILANLKPREATHEAR